MHCRKNKHLFELLGNFRDFSSVWVLARRDAKSQRCQVLEMDNYMKGFPQISQKTGIGLRESSSSAGHCAILRNALPILLK